MEEIQVLNFAYICALFQTGTDEMSKVKAEVAAKESEMQKIQADKDQQSALIKELQE